MEEIKVGEYISRKEYLKKYDSNVGYALHIQKNIKRDDYARLNTGEIVKVIGIKENNVTKKAIYYGIYDTNWFDSSAVENFSANIKDLIEAGDIVQYKLKGLNVSDIRVVKKYVDARTNKESLLVKGFGLEQLEIKSILTKEQYQSNCYRLEE